MLSERVPGRRRQSPRPPGEGERTSHDRRHSDDAWRAGAGRKSIPRRHCHARILCGPAPHPLGVLPDPRDLLCQTWRSHVWKKSVGRGRSCLPPGIGPLGVPRHGSYVPRPRLRGVAPELSPGIIQASRSSRAGRAGSAPFTDYFWRRSKNRPPNLVSKSTSDSAWPTPCAGEPFCSLIPDALKKPTYSVIVRLPSTPNCQRQCLPDGRGTSCFSDILSGFDFWQSVSVGPRWKTLPAGYRKSNQTPHERGIPPS